MRLFIRLFVFCLVLSFAPVVFAGQKDKKGADGWLAKSQRQYLEYKFKQDHGYKPSGRAEIRAHEMYPHAHGHGLQVEIEIEVPKKYWNGFNWVPIQ